DAVLRRLLLSTQFSRSSVYRKISKKLIDSTGQYGRAEARSASSSSIGSSLRGHWGRNHCRTSFTKEDLDVWPSKIVNYQETNSQSECITVGTKRNLDNVKDYTDGGNEYSNGPSPALASKVSDSYSEIQYSQNKYYCTECQ